jgi:hypothetical protein
MGKTDLEKLRLLLPHWIEHNAEHAAEFRQWAEKARAAGKAGVSDDIDLAATRLEQVNVTLRAALGKLGAAA